MVNWTNFDALDSYQALKNVDAVNVREVMSGESGAQRVKKYRVPMAAGTAYT